MAIRPKVLTTVIKNQNISVPNAKEEIRVFWYNGASSCMCEHFDLKAKTVIRYYVNANVTTTDYTSTGFTYDGSVLYFSKFDNNRGAYVVYS